MRREHFNEKITVFDSSFIYTKSSPNTPKVFYRARRISLKNINVLDEYAENIFPYMENTPIDITLSRSRQISDKNKK